MKVYLEEKDMPKDCVNCDFGYANNFCYIDYEVDLRKFDKNIKHPKCPLQSLADYTRQVRKEVCAKIRESAISHNNLEVDMYYITPQQLYEIEQGETK